MAKMDPDDVKRTIRMRFHAGLKAGMSNADASAYANIAELSIPARLQSELGLLPATEIDAARQDPGQQSALRLSWPLELTSTDLEELRALFADHQSTAPVHILDESDPDVAPGLPAQISDALAESDLAADGSDERPIRLNVVPASSSLATVDRLPNGRFPPGHTGNRRGRPLKMSSDDFEPASELERILERTITVTQGGKKRKLKQATAILEQWVNQAVKGDHRARHELLAYADKHRIDLFRRQHKKIAKALAEAAVSSAYNLRVGLNINAHDFRPLPDVEKVRECWRAAATPRHSRWFSRNLWRGVGSG
jgi:hypothetical protein